MSVAPFMADTHCHLMHPDFNKDREKVFVRAQEAGVNHLLVPGLDISTSREAVDLANHQPTVYAAVGIHPHNAKTWEDNVEVELRKLSRSPHVVAIGEIGLDYYRNLSSPEKQRAAFQAQLEIAANLELPVVIHNREATDDVMAHILPWSNNLPSRLKGRSGVMHAFSSDLETALCAIEAGFYLGVGGSLTHPKRDHHRQVVALLPLERQLIETDSPFLTPHPNRNKRNEPANVRLIAERLARLLQISPDIVAKTTSRNASDLFGWDYEDDDCYIL